MEAQLPLGVSFARRLEPQTDLGWAVHPAGFRSVLLEAACYGLPIYITENGLADRDDRIRGDYILSHLKEVAEANGIAELHCSIHVIANDGFGVFIPVLPDHFMYFGFLAEIQKARAKLFKSGRELWDTGVYKDPPPQFHCRTTAGRILKAVGKDEDDQRHTHSKGNPARRAF